MLFTKYAVLPAALCVLASACTQEASAAVINDPANDFLTTFTGPPNGDLDVLTAEVIYDGSFFTFRSRSNGSIGTTPGAFYVWGVDRGQGTARFGSFASGVLFDSVVILTPGGASTVRDLVGGAPAATLDPAAVTISGATLSASVSASLLPSRGFAPGAYTVNLWPRLAGNNDKIADFAPDNSNAPVTNATPEPGSLALLGSALAGLGVLLRRRATR